jgi:hypothetical protein
MPTINSATTRGTVQSQGNDFLYSSWEEVRDLTNGNSVVVNTDNSNAILAGETINKLGTTWDCSRYFMAFDTSSVTSVPGSAFLNVYGFSTSTTDFIGVKATSPSTSTNIATTDYSNIVGYSPTLPMNGNVTEYTDYVSAGISTTSYTSIPLTSTALSDMNSLSVLQIALVSSYDYDYVWFGGFATTRYRTGISATNAPYITYTAFGGQIFSLPLIDVSKVNDISISNINAINT